MSLGEYLREAATRPWEPGRHDCCAFPARWAGIALPAYATEAEGEALIAAAGSLEALWERHLAGRMRRTDEPEEGDVGIIRAVGMDRVPSEVGAIWTGKRWAFACPRGGIACASAEALAIWRA